MKRPKPWREILADLIFWSGLVLICLVAVPVSILLGLIFLIRAGVDFSLKRLRKE